MPLHYYIYLHGFASSPQSSKARYLGDRFHASGLELVTPDLNQDDFFNLTLTRQLDQAKTMIPTDTAVTVIGSSLGGLTAAWLAERCPQVQRMVLLAPAFGFLAHWLERLGEPALQQWRETGTYPVYHYHEKQTVPLSYRFLEDAATYDETELKQAIPTLILHGQQDEVIPVQASRDYARSRPWVTLVELGSDHALANVLPEIWEATASFCGLEKGS
jgi:predicted esterase YcpF (UPF0227 family)